MSRQQWDDGRLDRLANSVEGLTNRVDSIASSVESLTNRVDNIASSVESLTNRVDNIASSVEGLTNRVDNIASSLETLTNRVDNIAIATENNNRLIESNARAIQTLVNVAAEAREEREQLFQRMDQHQANITHQQTIIFQQQEEIRGLQTENRRILDILLNQLHQGDNPDA